MQPLTLQKLAGNAYRMLGLSASSDLAAIENAARRMRIWSDAQRIPPTPWDFCSELGPIVRSRGNIEKAVAVLNEPKSRVEERLLWYHGDGPPNPQATPTNEAGPLHEHNQTLMLLHFAYATDPDIGDATGWRMVVERLAEFATSSTYISWLQQAEANCDFEKRASPDEINTAVKALLPALAAGLIPKAESALDRNDLQTCAGIVPLLRIAGASKDAADPARRLLDGLEDTVNRRCCDLDAELRGKLRTNHQTPAPFYDQNRGPTAAAARSYNEQVDPLRGHLHTLAADDSERLLRVRTQCADVLTFIALGWEWSGQFETAIETLHLALNLVATGPSAISIREALGRCESLLEIKRQAARSEAQMQGVLNVERSIVGLPSGPKPDAEKLKSRLRDAALTDFGDLLLIARWIWIIGAAAPYRLLMWLNLGFVASTSILCGVYVIVGIFMLAFFLDPDRKPAAPDVYHIPRITTFHPRYSEPQEQSTTDESNRPAMDETRTSHAAPGATRPSLFGETTRER